MDQGSERVTSPSPSPRIRRGNRNGLCANVFVRSGRKIIFALGLVEAPDGEIQRRGETDPGEVGYENPARRRGEAMEGNDRRCNRAP